ncbi:MAG TPA: N-acetyl-gamma-glutamyl-phosphate reductase [Terriglobales bacterium]|nr:N-acetyl-gamma-glutamyl-phosphate reductase [Terriglobales bacterium]
MNKYSSARIGVAGAAGYAGRELLRWLGRHPRAAVVAKAGSEGTSEAMADAQPDFVFLATPPEVSRDWVAGLHAAGSRARVVDLSGAYRFDPEVVYGWPERNAAAIATAKLVSNPGCYATAANLALGPLIQAGVIAPEEIVCDAKSGASGAGKGPRPDLQFCELEGNCKAYHVYQHRHAPEIARHAGVDEATFAFTPHLLPTGRGILATLYVRPATDAAGIAAAYERAYAGAPFVRLRGGELPEMGALAHTNFCDLGWKLRPDGKQAVIVSCLDNLVKGAAGQAIQNFNLMAGFAETEGLA